MFKFGILGAILQVFLLVTCVQGYSGCYEHSDCPGNSYENDHNYDYCCSLYSSWGTCCDYDDYQDYQEAQDWIDRNQGWFITICVIFAILIFLVPLCICLCCPCCFLYQRQKTKKNEARERLLLQQHNQQLAANATVIHTTHYPGGVGAVPIGTVIHPAAGGVYPNIQPQQQQQFYGQPASDLPPSYDNVAASFSNDVNPDSSSGPGEMTTVYNVK